MKNQGEATQAPVKVLVEAQTFVCANCGGVMGYDIESEKFRCSSCKAESSIETLAGAVLEYDFSDYARREQDSVAFDGLAVVHCQNCGREITFDEYQIAATCPMCGSSQVAAVKQAAGIPPEGIIPFQIDKTEAAQQFKGWVKSRWFAPSDFKKKCDMGQLKGMYLPFWTYDAAAISTYMGRGGNTRTIRDDDGKTRTVTDWTFVSGVVSESFDDVQVCASQKGKDIAGILPFHTAENAKPYASLYLSGFYAELYTIKADTAFETAKNIMETELRSLAEQDIRRSFDIAEVSSLTTKYCNVTYKHLLLPVWSSAFGYRGKAYNYFVNGETGKVDGRRPYSVSKIVSAVIAAIVTISGALFFLNSGSETPQPAGIAMTTQQAVVYLNADNYIEPLIIEYNM